MVKENGRISEQVQDGRRENEFAAHGDQAESTTSFQSDEVTRDQDLLCAFGYAFVMYYM